MPVDLIQVVERDTLDFIMLRRILHAPDNFLLNTAIDHKQNPYVGVILLQLRHKVANGRPHAEKVFLLPICKLHFPKGRIAPAVIGAAKDDYGINRICLKKSGFQEFMVATNKGGGFGAISQIAGITNGRTGPAVVLDQLCIGALQKPPPPGLLLAHIGYRLLRALPTIAVISGKFFGNISSVGRITVTENQKLLYHFNAALNTIWFIYRLTSL